MLRTRPLAAALLAVAAVPVIAAASAPAQSARTRVVTIEDVRYRPATLRVERGDRVRWVWRDGPTPHDVRSRGTDRFRGSSVKTEGGTHMVSFRRSGTYRYICTVHPGMKGRVGVR